MLANWNLVDEETVRNNPSEIRVYYYFLHLAIKYFQKTNIIISLNLIS